MPRHIVLATATCFVCSLVVLLAVSESKADVIYNIVDYPVNETDSFNSAQDTLSGTIVTDGNTGTLTASDILGGSWTVSNATSGSVSYTITAGSLGDLQVDDLTASATELTLPSGGGLLLPIAPSSPIQLAYANNDPLITPTNYGFAAGDNVAGPFFVTFAPPATAGSIAENSTWLVATAAPEPATFTLLLPMAGGVCWYCMQRRVQRLKADRVPS